MQSPNEDKNTTNPESDTSSTQPPLVDPSGRYERSNELLGRGASKEVYKAFDREEGMEVAWNQLKVDHLSEQSAAKILSEIQILTQLDNENIIKFYHSWVKRNSTGNYDVFFITELMTSGTLKNYLQKTKGALKLKIVKNWCRQILRALEYLHNKTPPIIHRDLKCDNVFINGNNGQAKLGDFGLAVLKDREMLTSVLGTPEFMAPELYDENYDEKVDVYAFGLCLLEMVTKDYPYSECDNAAQIYRKVTQGIKPLALTKVQDSEVKSFIELCIDFDSSKRPTVNELLSHEFMVIDPDNKTTTNGVHVDFTTSLPTTPTEGIEVNDLGDIKMLNCQVEVVSLELPAVNLRLKLTMTHASANKEVKFPFDFDRDTVAAVVQEMVREHVLQESDGELVAAVIRESIKEPLVTYEMARANAPARAELNESATSPVSVPNGGASVNPSSIDCSSIGVSVPSLGSEVSSTISSVMTQPILPTQGTPSLSDKVELSDAEADLIIQDHPEVAALLLRQKKEIELLALFHRREHQALLKTLRRQLNGTRSSGGGGGGSGGGGSSMFNGGSMFSGGSMVGGTPTNAINNHPPNATLGDMDELQFISKVRHLLYESTGNLAWLPDGVAPAPNATSSTMEQ